MSPHNPERLYFASYRVWRSENRGDEWTPVSGDLTRNEDRFTLPIMGRKQSFENPWDVNAMSNYNTITSLAESPLNRQAFSHPQGGVSTWPACERLASWLRDRALTKCLW